MDIEKYSGIFRVLGDANRMQIMKMLQDGDKCANDILDEIKLSQSTLSHHLKQLTDAGLIVANRVKKTLYYSINNKTVRESGDVLGSLLTELSAEEQKAGFSGRFNEAAAMAFGKLVKYMCMIDIRTDSYRVMESKGGKPEYSDFMPNAGRNLRSSIDFIIGTDLKEDGRNFVDLRTLDERMDRPGAEDKLDFVFESPSIGWVKAGFIAVSRDAGGKLEEVIYALWDIAEEKKEEQACKEQLSQMMDKAEEEEILQREFLSRMSSNFRNPLNGIMGTVDVIRRVADDRDMVLDCAGKIERASLSLLALIKDMSEMSEIESGKLLFVNESNNVWDLIRDVCNVVEPTAEKMGVNFIRKRTGKITHPDIICSGSHFRYLLRKILENIIESCHVGDEVSFDFREQDMFGDKASFLITIEDNGRGGRRENGFPMCQQIIEKIGGVINVETPEGANAKTAMILPFEVDKTVLEKDGGMDAISLEGKNVLLVEDNELNLEIEKFLLEDFGARVITAMDGEEAVRLFSRSGKSEIDIILMDIMMPKMDGLTASRKIRRLNRKDAESVPIIAMSAKAMKQDVDKSMSAGMNAHVSKPLNVRKLLSEIENYIR